MPQAKRNERGRCYRRAVGTTPAAITTLNGFNATGGSRLFLIGAASTAGVYAVQSARCA